MNTNPDPDPIRIQGFNDQKLKKKYVQVTEEAFSSQNTSKHELLQIFFYFCGSFLPSWIRIRIPDPDPLTRLHPDPIRIRIRNPEKTLFIKYSGMSPPNV
jgi:hypothetical protein